MDEYYDGIVINAHLFAYLDEWLPTFLGKIDKPFFFDPVTYVFGRPLDYIRKEDGKLKKSFEELRNYYGEQLRKITQKRQLLPKDFIQDEGFNNRFINELVNRVLSFQENPYPLTNTQKSLQEYSEILGEELTGKREHASHLVAPYFYFQSPTDPWYTISLQLARLAQEEADQILYVPICTSPDVLTDRQSVNKIIDDYNGFDGYLLWFSDLKEKHTTTELLNQLKRFVEKLSLLGKPIYNLYGGHFSALLKGTGIVRGICYGTSREIDRPALDMEGMRTLYYLPSFMLKITEDVARTIFTDKPELLCDCSICSQIKEQITGEGETRIENFFEKLTFENARKHFMLNFYTYLQKYSKMDQRELKEALERAYRAGEELAKIYGIQREHLLRWENALKSKEVQK